MRNLGLSRPHCLLSAGVSPLVCFSFASWLSHCLLSRASASRHLPLHSCRTRPSSTSPLCLHQLVVASHLFARGHEKKVKYHGLVPPYTHVLQVKIYPRQKSGYAVACASVTSVRLHCLIHHKGTNTRRIIARRGGMGGEVLFYIIGNLAQLSRDTSFGGLFLKARETFQK
jgi:hypothetical protein